MGCRRLGELADLGRRAGEPPGGADRWDRLEQRRDLRAAHRRHRVCAGAGHAGHASSQVYAVNGASATRLFETRGYGIRLFRVR
jgi:hypothetical protein